MKKTNEKNYASVPSERINQSIYVMRGYKVMLDRDLADLYGVSTKVLNQAVTRNKERFPKDFMFKLDKKEDDLLRSQSVTSTHGGRRYAPNVYTEQGIAMLSSVLRSERAVQVNIAIMRAFVLMREAMISHKDLTRRINDMERKYDIQFKAVFDAMRKLMEQPPLPKKRPIGYIFNEED
jgi:ORF6N domain